MQSTSIDFPALLQTLGRQDAQFRVDHYAWLPDKSWDDLKAHVMSFGDVRNEYLIARMPREEEVIRRVDGTTPGIYPVRESNRTRSALESILLGQKIPRVTKYFEATPSKSNDPERALRLLDVKPKGDAVRKSENKTHDPMTYIKHFLDGNPVLKTKKPFYEKIFFKDDENEPKND